MSEFFHRLVVLLHHYVTWNIVVGAIIGAVFSGLIALFFDWLRRPRLEMDIESPPHEVEYTQFPDRPIVRTLRLIVANNPYAGSSPALQCRGRITFHHETGQDVFGRVMEARWAHSRQPIKLEGRIVDTGAKIEIYDPDRLSTQSRVHIYRGESEPLDIAARFRDEEECYGWNNEAYFHHWRTPHWQLPRGRYLVRVEITSSAKKCVRFFRLVNDVPRTDFRLGSVSRKEIRLIESARKREKLVSRGT